MINKWSHKEYVPSKYSLNLWTNITCKYICKPSPPLPSFSENRTKASINDKWLSCSNAFFIHLRQLKPSRSLSSSPLLRSGQRRENVVSHYWLISYIWHKDKLYGLISFTLLSDNTFIYMYHHHIIHWHFKKILSVASAGEGGGWGVARVNDIELVSVCRWLHCLCSRVKFKGLLSIVFSAKKRRKQHREANRTRAPAHTFRWWNPFEQDEIEALNVSHNLFHAIPVVIYCVICNDFVQFLIESDIAWESTEEGVRKIIIMPQCDYF